MNDNLTKRKMCTMNCGPAIGNTRTQSERQSACGDCIDAPVERVAFSDDQIAEIGNQSGIGRILTRMLDDDQWNNFEPSLLKFARAILAAQFDVSDINVGDMPENDAGIGLAPEPDVFKSAMPAKLRALSKHMERIAVEMDYLGGFAEWAKHGVELFGAADVVDHWAHEIEAIAIEELK